MTRMTGPDCADMCNLINTRTHTHTHTNTHAHKPHHARDRIGEGGEEAKKRKKPQEIYRRDVENGGDLGGKRKECRQESIGSIDVDPEALDNI